MAARAQRERRRLIRRLRYDGVRCTPYDGYVSIAFLSDGSRDISTETVSADGCTWTSQSTMTTSTGQTVPVRSVTTISPDGMRQTSTTEVSPDGGKTWKHWYKDESHKVKE
ncbi:MAG: hypothetical protein QM570_15365 [Planctomycetota bacterium]|nr:hypothetical protein [Planctomycetota bacterium]